MPTKPISAGGPDPGMPVTNSREWPEAADREARAARNESGDKVEP